MMNRFQKIILILLALTLPSLAFCQVYINEVLASNKKTNEDALFLKSSDWIELYNASAEAIDLSNYFLTNDIQSPQMWKFPPKTLIKGHSFLLIWADAKKVRLHTNFKLKAEQSFLALYHQEQLIDSVSLFNQKEDVSLGRLLLDQTSDKITKKLKKWHRLDRPSPYFNNSLVQPLKNSKSHLKTKLPKHKMIGKALFEKEQVHQVRIQFQYPQAYDSLNFYKEKSNQNLYLQANVVVDGKTYYASGIRIKGESSYEFYPGQKKSFKLKFNQFIKDQKIDGLSCINLNNGFKDPSMMREKILFDAMRAEGLPAPRVTYANVFVNDEAYGLYFLVEDINKPFFNFNFGNKDGHLYKGEPKADYVKLGDSVENYRGSYLSSIGESEQVLDQDLVDLIQAINCETCSPKALKAGLDAHLNTEACLKIFAMTSFFCNIDAYNLIFSHNHYLYGNREHQKFEWIPYDGNYAFCAWSPTFTYKAASELDIYYIRDSINQPLMTAFFKNPEYKEFYTSFMKTLVNKRLNDFYIEKEVDRLAVLIRKYIYEDPKKMYTNAQFEQNLNETIGDPLDPGAFVPGIKSFYKDRRLSILKQLDKK